MLICDKLVFKELLKKQHRPENFHSYITQHTSLRSERQLIIDRRKGVIFNSSHW